MTKGRENRILVTGATGFLGGTIVERLVSTGATPYAAVRRGDLPHRLANTSGVQIVEDFDLLDPAKLRAVVQTIRPDQIVHAAAFGVSAQDDLVTSLHANTLGTAVLAEAAHEFSVSRFVHLGTSLEYADCDERLSELAPLSPITTYGVSKACASLILNYMHRVRSFPCVTLRLFSLYGPWEQSHKLIPYVITSALKGERVNLTAGGQERDYLYVDDAVDAVLLALRGGLDHGEVYNVASGQPRSVADVAQETLQRLDREDLLSLGSRTAQRPDVRCARADTDKLRRAGWSPQVSFGEGLDRTIAWFRTSLMEAKV